MRLRILDGRSEAGFTLIDTMMALMLIGILAAMATFQIGAVRPALQGDGAMRVVMSELNAARDLAIAQRRYMAISFVGTNQLRITREEVPTGSTVLREVAFEAGMQYTLFSSLPDTPDSFGKGSATDFGSATIIRFGTDGALIDETGTPLNGTIFIAQPGVQTSYRAITIQGSTGRIRAYRWIGNQWQRV